MAFYLVSDAFERKPGFVLIGYRPLNHFVLCFIVNPSFSDQDLKN